MADALIVPSARKHGVHDDDILHAYRHPMRVFQMDDLVMLVGPSRSGLPLEIGVTRAHEGDIIIHAMPARAKFLR